MPDRWYRAGAHSRGTRCADAHREQRRNSGVVRTLPHFCRSLKIDDRGGADRYHEGQLHTAQGTGSLGFQKNPPLAYYLKRPIADAAIWATARWAGGRGLTDAVTVREAENALDLVEGNVLLNLHHVPVEAWAGPAKTIRIKPQAQRVAFR